MMRRFLLVLPIVLFALPSQAQTPLRGLIDVLVAGGNEAAYSAVAGVTWSSNETDGPYYRRGGKLRLAGFGEADMPSGTGADAKTVRGNEGDALVTVYGRSGGAAHLVSVQKFHQSTNYEPILRNQVGAAAKIARIASACPKNEDGEPDAEAKAEFFRIDLDGGRNVFARLYLGEGMKHTPSLTWLELWRERPDEKIKDMGCRVEG